MRSFLKALPYLAVGIFMITNSRSENAMYGLIILGLAVGYLMLKHWVSGDEAEPIT